MRSLPYGKRRERRLIDVGDTDPAPSCVGKSSGAVTWTGTERTVDRGRSGAFRALCGTLPRDLPRQRAVLEQGQ